MSPPDPLASRTPVLAQPDPWLHLRRFTAARIALGRCGGSQPTAAVLDFRLSHARARDAVWTPFHMEALVAALKAAGWENRLLQSAARDRREYLRRPDLGRSLSASSRAELQMLAAMLGPLDLAVVVSDGLSAAAVDRHAAATILPLLQLLRSEGWRVSPVFIVPFARVKLQDEIGGFLSARYSLMVLGERPGLGAPDSLGAYFTANPGPERTDADRNCISNIRPEGLPPAAAAAKLAWLLKESSATGNYGVGLKDTQPPQPGLAT